MRYKTWVTRFNADPTLINKTFVLNGTPCTLIGVMPPRFAFGDADMWIPRKPSPSAAQERNGFPIYWFLLAHLKPGVSIRQAESDLTVVAKIFPPSIPRSIRRSSAFISKRLLISSSVVSAPLCTSSLPR
jgi:putative ABC transport system permease protein